MSSRVSGALQDWATLESRYKWSGILLGNGGSRAVWEEFKYPSLYARARTAVSNPLTADDVEVFEALATRNFEEVLESLRVSQIVCRQQRHAWGEVRRRYQSIRRALIEAVKSVHVRWADIPDATLDRIRNALRQYDFVYSTNYDLIAYWAIMSGDAKGFRDYFWGARSQFDITDTSARAGLTRVLYLHGGLHIYRLPSGTTAKRSPRHGLNLLDLVGTNFRGTDTPLFITEGNAAAKLSSIRRSAYLSFVYKSFAEHEGALIVFGQALAASDGHLLGPMRRWGRRRIAVAVLPGSRAAVVERKAQLIQRLPKAELLFFNALTHPLGDPELRVTVPTD